MISCWALLAVIRTYSKLVDTGSKRTGCSLRNLSNEGPKRSSEDKNAIEVLRVWATDLLSFTCFACL
jgi:hypothetical protein